MQSWQRWICAAACLAGSWALRLEAQDMPLPPWRPIPELQTLLWYTDFDESADAVKKLFDRGKIATGKPNPENDPMMSLGAVGGGNQNKEVECYIKINATPARFPDKINPNQVFVQFNIWASETGKVEVWVRSGLDVNDWLTVPRAGAWCPVKTSLGQLANKGDRIKPESLVSEIHLKFKPSRAGEKLPEVYVDKFIVTQGPPERIAMMLMAWQAKMSKLSKTIAADGFCYEDKMHTTMQKLSLRNSRRGPVLVFLPPTSGNGNDDASAPWNAAAQEAKMRGVQFEAAQDPRKLPLASLTEVRAFLPYLLQTSDAQAAMLVVTKEEGSRAGKEAESLQLILERLLAVRCMPLLCLPAADESDKKLGEFLKTAVKLCDEMGVPYADQGFAFKKVPKPYVAGKLTAEGEKALRELLVASYKHIQDALNPRR